MSFEDDEYWDDEYSDQAATTNAAVAQERPYVPRNGPDPVLPTRRPAPGQPGVDQVDELAARRQRRATGSGMPRKPQAAFDSQRPSWLDDPDFVPIDTSAPNLAGDEFDDVDFNRPELGADFDAPDFLIGSVPQRDDRSGDDDIDEPFDHRELDRGAQVVHAADWDEVDERETRKRSAGRRWGRRPARAPQPEARPRPESRPMPESRPVRDARPAAETRPQPGERYTEPAASGRARVPAPEAEEQPYRRPEPRGDRMPRDRVPGDRVPGDRVPGERWSGPIEQGERRPYGDYENDPRRRRQRVSGYPDDEANRFDVVYDERSGELQARPARPAGDPHPVTAIGDYEQGYRPVDDDEAVTPVRRGGRVVEWGPDEAFTSEDDDRRPGTPRVISKPTPPAQPRVIGRNTPPAVPRVIKKADPPTPPRVVSAPAPVTPPRIPGPDRPADAQPVSPAASARPTVATHPDTARDGRRPDAAPTSPAHGGRADQRPTSPAPGAGHPEQVAPTAPGGQPPAAYAAPQAPAAHGGQTPGPYAAPPQVPAAHGEHPTGPYWAPPQAPAAHGGQVPGAFPAPGQHGGQVPGAYPTPPPVPGQQGGEASSAYPASPPAPATHAGPGVHPGPQVSTDQGRPAPAAPPPQATADQDGRVPAGHPAPQQAAPAGQPTVAYPPPPQFTGGPAQAGQGAPVSPAGPNERAGGPSAAPPAAATQSGPAAGQHATAPQAGPLNPGWNAVTPPTRAPQAGHRADPVVPQAQAGEYRGQPRAGHGQTPPGRDAHAPRAGGPGISRPGGPVAGGYTDPRPVSGGQPARPGGDPPRPAAAAGRSPADTDPRMTYPGMDDGRGALGEAIGGPRSRRSPRTAHVHLSEGDGPWSMVPDAAPPPALPVSGLSQPLSWAAPRADVPMPPMPAPGPGMPPPGHGPAGPYEHGRPASRPPAAHQQSRPAPGQPTPGEQHGRPVSVPPATYQQGQPTSVPPAAYQQGRPPTQAARVDGVQPAAFGAGPGGAPPAAARPGTLGDIAPAAGGRTPEQGRPAEARPAGPGGPQRPTSLATAPVSTPVGGAKTPLPPTGAWPTIPLQGGAAPADRSPAGPARSGPAPGDRPRTEPTHVERLLGGTAHGERSQGAAAHGEWNKGATAPSERDQGAAAHGDRNHGATVDGERDQGATVDGERNQGATAHGEQARSTAAPAPDRAADFERAHGDSRPGGHGGSAPQADAAGAVTDENAVLSQAAESEQASPWPHPGPGHHQGGAETPGGGGRHGQIMVPTQRPPVDSPASSGAESGPQWGATVGDATAHERAEQPHHPDQAEQARQAQGAEQAHRNDQSRGDEHTQRDEQRQRTEQGDHARRAAHAAPNNAVADGAAVAERDGAERRGAHAAPYMDPDGTLHNLRPIAKLDVSGPDAAPRRPSDSDFGGMWFAPKTDGPDAEGAEAPSVKAGAIDDNSGEVATSSPDVAGAGNAAGTGTPGSGGAHRSAAPPVEPRDAGQREAAPAEVVGPVAGSAGSPDGKVADHVVLDLTGLINGVTAEAEPARADAEPRRADAEPARADAEPRRADAEPVRADVNRRHAVLMPVPEPEEDAEPEKDRPALSAADLEAIRWRLDGGTLREVVDDKDALRVLGERLDEPLADEVDNVAKAGLLSVRAEVYRLLGELGMAAAASRLALAHAESAQDVQSTVIAQAELAHTLRLRGDHKEADRLFTRAAGARAPETLRSVVHENAGRSCFDQGRHMEALDHFATAVRLGRPDDAELAARIGVCLEAVYIHVLRDGWGPYPRSPEDILGRAKKKTGALDEVTTEHPVVHPRS